MMRMRRRDVCLHSSTNNWCLGQGPHTHLGYTQGDSKTKLDVNQFHMSDGLQGKVKHTRITFGAQRGRI